MAPVSSKKFLDIQAALECGLILKRVRIRTYSHFKIACSDHTKIMRSFEERGAMVRIVDISWSSTEA